MQNLELDETTKKTRKMEDEMKKELEESIISDKNENTDIEETTSKITNSDEAAAVIQ